MITCPKCLVPNPDGSAACMACGTALAAQQFAQALDRAQAPAAPQASPSAAPMAYAPAPSDLPASPAPTLGQGAYGDASALGSPDGSFGYAPAGGLGGMVGLDAGSADVSAFMQAQKAKKRNKAMVWVVAVGLVVAVLGFLGYRSSQKKALREEVGQFVAAFRKVDDGEVDEFWKCVVRSKGVDVRLAPDNMLLTNGLEQAFKSFPKSQPDHLKKKCLPLLDTIAASFGQVKPPSGFAARLDALKAVFPAVKSVFDGYANKLDSRKQLAANEQAILAASAAFHDAQQSDQTKSWGYVSLLACAVPDLPKMAAKVQKAPDTQLLIEHIFKTCKAEPSYADKLRKECYAGLEGGKKHPAHAAVHKKMAGDDRDRSALEDCFKRANKGFFDKDLNEVGQAWVKYREARKAVLDEVAKYKDEH
ncbi:MAG: hypothetical protein IT371_03260 [Deltaproteobacteria bacterium]|nr:hypothetical protein [Deltaproteobacteria bacterium]